MSTELKTFYDEVTSTLTYLIFSNTTKDAVIIDPVLDFDMPSGRVSTESMQKLTSFLDENELNLKMILETHAHADHLTAASELKRLYPDAKIGVAETIKHTQATFCDIFESCEDVPADGSQFDLLFSDNQKVEAGALNFKVIYTPGHTPACASYLFDKMLFTGDAIFMPDYGTGRCDFPQGSAEDLYDTITQKIYALPDDTEIYVGHDYQPGGRDLKYKTTVKEQKTANIHINENTSKTDFITMRTERDKTLSTPKLLMPSIQVNINAGVFPKSKKSDKPMLTIPVIMPEA